MKIQIKDPFSGLSHLFGALLSIAALSVLVTLAAFNSTVWHVVSFSIYGSGMILLYSASAAYHLIPLGDKGTKRLKKLDHVMIFVMIAACYTPFCLVPLRGGWGWSIFGVIWGLALLGAFFKLFYISAPRWISTAIYLVMGWICIIAIYPIVKTVSAGGVFWLAAGGIFYSIGAVIYGIKKPNPISWFGFHEIWHLFVMAGSFCHFIVMIAYIMKIS